MKTCKAKGCRVKFEQRNSFHVACSPKCAINVVREKNELKSTEARVALKKARDAAQTLPELTKKAEKAFNAYIRARDHNDQCISCEKGPNWGGQWHASHFRPAGNYKIVRFNTFNVHKACSECNKHKSGNLTEYEIRLVDKIGSDKVEWLKLQNKPTTYSGEYLRRLAKIFNRRARLTKKRRGI